MRTLGAAMGRAFLHAFVAALITFGIGILAAPAIHRTYLLGVAAILGSAVAGLKAIQGYVPQLSFRNYAPPPWGSYLDAFLRAFIGALAVTLPGVLGAPDLNTGRALGAAAILGALTAGLRALEGAFTGDETPAGGKGIVEPDEPHLPAHGPPAVR